MELVSVHPDAPASALASIALDWDLDADDCSAIFEHLNLVAEIEKLDVEHGFKGVPLDWKLRVIAESAS